MRFEDLRPMNPCLVELRTNLDQAKAFDLRVLHFGLLLHWRSQEMGQVHERVSFHPFRSDAEGADRRDGEPLEMPGVAVNRERMLQERGEPTELNRQLVRSSVFKITIEPINPLGQPALQQVFLLVKARSGRSMSQPLGLTLHFGPRGESSVGCQGEGADPQRIWAAEAWQHSRTAKVPYRGSISEYTQAYERHLSATVQGPDADPGKNAGAGPGIGSEAPPPPPPPPPPGPTLPVGSPPTPARAAGPGLVRQVTPVPAAPVLPSSPRLPVWQLGFAFAVSAVAGALAFFWLFAVAERVQIGIRPTTSALAREAQEFNRTLDERLCAMTLKAVVSGPMTPAKSAVIVSDVIKDKRALDSKMQAVGLAPVDLAESQVRARVEECLRKVR